MTRQKAPWSFAAVDIEVPSSGTREVLLTRASGDWTGWTVDGVTAPASVTDELTVTAPSSLLGRRWRLLDPDGRERIVGCVVAAKAGSASEDLTVDVSTGATIVEVTIAGGGGGGAVDSVNGETGVVVLDAGDVGAVPTARTITAGTGLTGGGDLSADRTLTVSFGATAGTAAEGNDARLTDARTPTAHAASHQDGGSDELALDGSQITSGTVAAARLGSGTASASTFLRGDGTWADSGQRRPNIGYVEHATSGFGTVTLTGGQIRTRLFGPWLPVGWVITGVGVEVTTTGAGAAATVALWEATDRGQPTALLGQAEIGLTALGAVGGTFTAVVPTTPLVVAGIRYHTGVAPQVRTTAHPTPLESAVYALAAPATGTTAAYTAYLSAAVAPNLTLSWGLGGPIRIYLKIEAA